MHSPKHNYVLCDAGNRPGEELGGVFLALFFPTRMGVNKPSFQVTHGREAQGLKAATQEH